MAAIIKIPIRFSVLYERDTSDGCVWIHKYAESRIPMRDFRRVHFDNKNYHTQHQYWNSDPTYFDAGFDGK